MRGGKVGEAEEEEEEGFDFFVWADFMWKSDQAVTNQTAGARGYVHKNNLQVFHNQYNNLPQPQYYSVNWKG